MPDDEVEAELVAVKGLGQWTAHMFLMFHLQRPDVLPVGDLGIRRAVERAYALPDLPDPAALTERRAVAPAPDAARAATCGDVARQRAACAGERDGPASASVDGEATDRRDLFVRHAERGAAAAGGDHVRVLDLEAGALEVVDVVDRRALTYGRLGPSTSRRMPLSSNTSSPSRCSSNASAYWKPEQPPPRTPTRRPAVSTSLPCEARNSRTFSAPLSVSVIIASASIATPSARYPCTDDDDDATRKN